MNPIFEKLTSRGFHRVNTVKPEGESEFCCLTSYNCEGADTTVMRFENGNMFVAIGLMGQRFIEMTVGIQPLGMVYKKPLKEFSDKEFDDLLHRIRRGEIPTPQFFKRELDGGRVVWEMNPEWV